MGASNARGALQQLQAVGLEDAEERAEWDVHETLDGGAVGGHALGPPRAIRLAAVGDGELVLAALLVTADDHAGGLGVEADQVTVVAGARRAAGAAKVEALQQVRLAGAVRPVDDGQAGPEARFRAGVGAEVAELHAEHAHDAILTRSGVWA